MSGDHQPYTANTSPALSENQDACRFLELVFYIAPSFLSFFPAFSSHLHLLEIHLFNSERPMSFIEVLPPFASFVCSRKPGQWWTPHFPFLFSVWKQCLSTYFCSFLVVYEWRLNPILVASAWLEVEVK